ncbi:MAG: valine--tRNA ligase [Clostridia bacterium]|nr:valine--tRNA ligase [Clostridia bacterium]
MQKKYDFRECEIKWQNYWENEEIYKFDKNSSKPLFSVDTPPVTISGTIHIGHIFSFTQAEFMVRYKRMTGFNVFYPFGFDDNGLPTERLVEKERKIKAHQLPREEFNRICLEVLGKYRKDFKEVFARLGDSADWNLLYSTIEPRVQRIGQLSFLRLAKEKNAYYGDKPAIWCPECQVSIAQAELDSKEIESYFNYLYFQISDAKPGKSKEENSIKIATTRPEFLCACVCVFVNPKDKRYKNFIGKKVIVPLYDFEVEVKGDEKVDMQKGTGAVMCCTFGDETDLEWQQKYNLPIKNAINDNGTMTSLAGAFAGKKTETARKEIIEELKAQGILYKQEKIMHAVAVHERCGVPMEIKFKKQWFIDILTKKQEFLDLGEKIKWHPSFMKNRYINWVENLSHDWCISRQRYFGIPIPVWYCADCGEIIFAEESQLPCNPMTTKPTQSACSKCGSKNIIPETDVFDTWQTSSVTPFINSHWGAENDVTAEFLPMSFRPHAHDIIRTWDFYTIVKSYYHTAEVPWKNLMISGFIMADKENKISKSKANSSKFSAIEVLNQKSADVTRYWASTGSLGRDIVVSDEEFIIGAKLINKIWNVSKFVLSFLQDYGNKKVSILKIDQWIIARFNAMQKQFKAYFEKYEIGLARAELEKFFWNFCDNYVEIAKRRLYNPDVYGEKATESARQTCFLVLKEMLKLWAIYLPHITEEIYKNFFEKYEGEKSIHLTQISEINEKTEDGIIPQGDEVVEIVAAVRRFKSENNLSLKEEINKLIIIDYSEHICDFEIDIKAVCSIKEVLYKTELGKKRIEIEN